MANEKRLIAYDPITFESFTRHSTKHREPDGNQYDMGYVDAVEQIEDWLDANTVDAMEWYECDKIVNKLECLLCHATGGKYSKAGYSLEDMERMVTDYIEECCEEAVAEEVVRCNECRLHLKCPTEEQFHLAKVKNPYCCLGERREGE